VSLDDDTDELDLVLGQTHHLLGEAGDELAQRLVQAARLTLRRDGGLPSDPRVVPRSFGDVTGPLSKIGDLRRVAPVGATKLR
jgi:hypothetical protein